ncbi:helix-turn-helix transcriptional regulator [Pedobacter sp. PF22-3]|jgi:y4mF family transcriptional regulator|uniref:helix-turn-helix transcriptional regulator n=1 Tax=Pedobacter sp. PF22-3 TaxID=2994467 RepID=UPI0022453226|nr:helix-turn-helix transcriptional regulator [Pedobacter sp. PF22-3]MCX2492520.1 helix-turn-helix transcriptional regulator [Pedobacter sp. PF22-3]
MQTIKSFVKAKRKELGLTQQDLALNAGVGLNFVRDLEQDKKTLRLDKVNEVLALFGKQVGVVNQSDENG